jgi:hypothetical protein
VDIDQPVGDLGMAGLRVVGVQAQPRQQHHDGRQRNQHPQDVLDHHGGIVAQVTGPWHP